MIFLPHEAVLLFLYSFILKVMWLLHIVGYVFIVAFLSKSKELLVFKGLYFVLTIAHTEKLLEYE